MLTMLAARAGGIEWPRRRDQQKLTLWRGLVLMGLVAAAGLVLSALVGLPTPIE
jgi:hypothetical protein